jgi:hypothetical protein
LSGLTSRANGEDSEVAEAFGVVPKCELSIRVISFIDDRVPLLLDGRLVPVDLRDLRDHRVVFNFFHIEGFLDTAGAALVEDMI